MTTLTKHKLIDVIELIGGGTPKTSVLEYWNGNIPWISVKDFNNDNRYVYSTEKYITKEGLNHSSTKLLQKDDIIISARGTVGELAMVPYPMAFNQSCYGIRGINSINQTFLYYLIKACIYKLKAISHGSVFDTITRDTFSNIDILLPDTKTQDIIAEFLSSVDDKIEINQSINNNLEQQAQAIFKSWFVDFEPFGGTMPNDWQNLTLGDVTENIRTRIGKNNYTVLSAVNTGKLQPSDEYFSKQVYSKNTEKYIIVKDGNFAYNPARINIGSIGINELGYTGCVSPVYVVFKVDKDYESFFRFYFKSAIFNEETKTRASGSVRQSLNYSDFALIGINYPSQNIAKQFNEIYKSFFKVKIEIEKENKHLTQLRDTLLPKLMSGEIDVSNVKIDEKFDGSSTDKLSFSYIYIVIYEPFIIIIVIIIVGVNYEKTVYYIIILFYFLYL